MTDILVALYYIDGRLCDGLELPDTISSLLSLFPLQSILVKCQTDTTCNCIDFSPLA